MVHSCTPFTLPMHILIIDDDIELCDLLKEFLEPMGMTQVELAKHLGWTWPKLNEIVNGRRGISAASALALGETFGTGPEFWLNLQRDWDLWWC